MKLALFSGSGWVHRRGSTVVWTDTPSPAIWQRIGVEAASLQWLRQLLATKTTGGAAGLLAVDLTTGEFVLAGGAVLSADGIAVADGGSSIENETFPPGTRLIGGSSQTAAASTESDLQSGTVQAGGFSAFVHPSDTEQALPPAITIGLADEESPVDPLLLAPSPVRVPGEPANLAGRRMIGRKRKPDGVSVTFDNGQVISVAHGVVIGRNPEKRGLPDRFVSATILGEHVSRVHWQLRIDRESIFLTDCGSGEGTHFRLPDGRLRSAPTGNETQVERGSHIFFADRWAFVD